MLAALEIAEKEQTPFGAAIALGDQLLATVANRTSKLCDPTAHAELLAIRIASEQLGKTDLSGHILYTTCEPCTMCMGAAIWAGIDTVFFGCSVEQISREMDQIDMTAQEVAKKAFYPVRVEGALLEERCLELLKRFG